ncbi:MAG: hypothetical protein ACREVA_12560, partial [Burkholderiales bacterium]
FYFWDSAWGPCSLKVCTYFPYPMKLWCNGHEWAKRRLEWAGVGYTPLSNGFAACDDPLALQQTCDQLDAGDVGRLFARCLGSVPLPLTVADRHAGCDWELSCKQVEYSRTLVLDRPLAARQFMETVIAENIGLGRPSEVEVIFGRRVRRNTPGRFHTRIVTRDVDVTMSIHYKQSRVKQYLKEGRAIRVETVINNPTDFGVNRRIQHLGELRAVAGGINRRILAAQRVAAGPDLSTSLFEQVALPYERDGQRTVALRYGDPRVMALMAALTLCLHQIAGFTNRSLRTLVATFLSSPYRPSQMSYDLWRLRTNGLIRRLPERHTYMLTNEGTRVALMYTKTYQRVLRPLLAKDPPAGTGPPPADTVLRLCLHTIDEIVDDYIDRAMIKAA